MSGRDAEHQAWYEEAADAIMRVADQGAPFNADDVWKILDAPPDGNRRRLGVAMRELADAGVLVKLGVDRDSYGREKSHAQPVSLWRAA